MIIICVPCVTCTFFTLLNDLYFIFALLIQVKYHFSFIIIIYIIIVTIIFMLLVIEGEFSTWIRAVWSTPTHWLLEVSRRINMKHFFCNLLFRDHLWGADALFYIYHMTSFNYNAKEARDVDLSCRCHLSDSQIVSSAFCVIHARENNLLVIVCKFMYICYCCYVFNSVVLFFCLFVCLSLLLPFVFFFLGIFHWILM